MAGRAVAKGGTLEKLRGRIEQWRLTRSRQGRMPEELWRAAASAARSYGVSPVASELGLGDAALKARTLAVPHRSGQAHAVAKPDGFIETRDIFMSLIHTVELHGGNPFGYLVALLRHHERVADAPGEWMPWNYHHAIETLGTTT